MTDEEANYTKVTDGVEALMAKIYPGSKFLVVTVWVCEAEDWVHIASNSKLMALKLLTDAKDCVENNVGYAPVRSLDS
jgi:hypothetical protein